MLFLLTKTEEMKKKDLIKKEIECLKRTVTDGVVIDSAILRRIFSFFIFHLMSSSFIIFKILVFHYTHMNVTFLYIENLRDLKSEQK